MAGGFEFLEHTADLKFRAWGSSLPEALVSCARAFAEATCGESVVKPVVEKSVVIKAGSLESLVHDWLSELIFYFSTESMLFSRFDLKVDGRYNLKARIAGEKYNPQRHSLFKEIKAATYHDMRIEEENGRWVIEVVCDT